MSQGPITIGNVAATLRPAKVIKPVFSKPVPPTPVVPKTAKASGTYHGQKR